MRPVLAREVKFLIPAGAAGHVREALRREGRRLGLDRTGFDVDGVKRRRVAFLDTPERALRERHRMVLRVRAEEGDDLALTLKCRSPDRLLVAALPMAFAEGVEGKEKVEEDVTWPFSSRTSRSLTTRVAAPPRTVGAAAAVFGGLDGVVAADLVPVGVGEVDEAVTRFEPARLDVGGGREVKVEAAVIAWAAPSGGTVTELSFRYRSGEDEREEYPLALLELTWALGEALHGGLGGVPGTKTAWMYGD